MCKGLFILRALITFISYVDSNVVIKVIRPGEGFITGGACERNMSYVSPLVTLQLRRLEEGSVTIGTYNIFKLLKIAQNKVGNFLTVCK